MKKTGLLKVITIITIVLAILTWILQANYFSDSMQNFGFLRVGLFDLFNYPILTFYYFEQEFLFLIAVGGFYGVLSKTKQYRRFVEGCAKTFKNHGIIFLVSIALILAVLNAFLGYGLLLFVFIPFLVAVIIMMGYDKITALLVTFLSPLIGIIGSVYSPNVNTYLNEITGLDYKSCIWYEIILFVVTFAVYAYFVVRHARKCKRDEKNELIEQDPYIGEKSEKKNYASIVVIFTLLFIMLILAFTPWNTVFNISKFEAINTSIMQYKLKKMTVFSYVFGQIGAFGTWAYTEMIILLIISSFIVGAANKLKGHEICEGFGKGIIEVLEAAIVITLAKAIVVISANHPIYPTILDAVMTKLPKFNVIALIISTILTSIASILNVDIIYLSQIAVPYLVSVSGNAKIISVATQSIHGLTMLFAPTSTLLILGLTYLNIPYKEWLKKSWKLIVELYAVIIFVLIVMLLK